MLKVSVVLDEQQQMELQKILDGHKRAVLEAIRLTH
jgi:hypothetical protein